jgi:hypothetical protein
MTTGSILIAIGIPILVNIMFNGILFMWIRQDMQELRSDLKLLTGKVIELDNEIRRK